MYCHWRIELTGQSLGKNNLKNVYFGKKCLKIKNHIFPLMTTFYDFALKIEASWAKKDVKPNLETWNVNYLVVYVWYVYSQIKEVQKYDM